MTTINITQCDKKYHECLICGRQNQPENPVLEISFTHSNDLNGLSTNNATIVKLCLHCSQMLVKELEKEFKEIKQHIEFENIWGDNA